MSLGAYRVASALLETGRHTLVGLDKIMESLSRC